VPIGRLLSLSLIILSSCCFCRDNPAFGFPFRQIRQETIAKATKVMRVLRRVRFTAA
jgi:hypothetical protein